MKPNANFYYRGVENMVRVSDWSKPISICMHEHSLLPGVEIMVGKGPDLGCKEVRIEDLSPDTLQKLRYIYDSKDIPLIVCQRTSIRLV